MNKQLQGLYGITSQDMLHNNQLLFQHVEQALKGGMSLLQYRNKQMPRQQSIADLIRLKQLCHSYNALFIINDDLQLCTDTQADGVHIGKHDGEVNTARQLLGEHAIIGVSCYNQLSLAQQAVTQGASYIAFGAFYPSATKPHAVIANKTLIRQAQILNTPVCCIGGITLQNAPELITRGCDMIAVISELFTGEDIQSNAENFCDLF